MRCALGTARSFTAWEDGADAEQRLRPAAISPAIWRLIALGTALGMVTAILAASPRIASATEALNRPMRPAARAAPCPVLTLPQAPAGLQAALRKAMGMSSTSPNGGFQQAKLTPSDGASGDAFGFSVAISGSTAIVGAYAKNSSTGAAYVFVASGTTWTEQAELTASDGASGDHFGSSVALSGTTAVVGAYGKNSFTGAAYVFVQSGTTWSQQAELTASDGAAGDDFGWSAALSGTTAVVGAYGKNSFTGAAYVFVQSGTTWSQQAELTASDAATKDEFGFSVAVSGSTALVGAPCKITSHGAAYVFKRSGTTWTQKSKFAVFVANDDFGYSVALSGTIAVVGDPVQASDAGASYVFVNLGTVWSLQAKLTASDTAPGDNFGYSVAVSGSTAVVGAPAKPYPSSVGAAYVFVQSGTTWSQQAELTASDAAPGDQTGSSVALSSTRAVLGAYGKNSSTGAGYVYLLPSQQAKLTASDGAAGDSFGVSVALSGTTAVVGAQGKNSSTGAAYVFVRSGSTWTQQAKLTAADGAAGDSFGVSVALSGTTAVVGANAKNSYTGAAYVFVSSGTTWSQQAELTASGGASQDYFGWSVAISGSTAVVGALFRPIATAAGAAIVFVRSGTTWSQQAELTASDGTSVVNLGWSVAISGSTLVAGAPYSGSGATAIGAAYVFVRSGTTWSQPARLITSDSAAGDHIGMSVAISKTTAVVGAPAKKSSTGAVYAFMNV
jgi:hypothetical protein